MIKKYLSKRLKNKKAEITANTKELLEIKNEWESIKDLRVANNEIKSALKTTVFTIFISIFTVINTGLIAIEADVGMKIFDSLIMLIGISLTVHNAPTVKAYFNYLKTIHKYSYKLTDLIKKKAYVENKSYKRNNIEQYLDNTWRKLRTVEERIEENTKEAECLSDLIESEDLGANLNYYENKYLPEILDYKIKAIIEDAFQNEWDEYLEYLNSIRPSEIDLSNRVIDDNREITTPKKYILNK